MDRFPASAEMARTPAGLPKEQKNAARTHRGGSDSGEAMVWNALFGGPPLVPAERAALDGIKKVRSLAAGQSVFSHQAVAHVLVALLDGEVALGFRTVDGTFRTERIVRGLTWLDLSSAWLEETHAMDARAMTPAAVVEVPRAELAAMLPEHPGLALRLIQELAHEVHALAANTHELMHKDAPARLAQWLRQRCIPVAGRDGEALVQLHERKRDVASQLAITPETLSRLMRSFTRLGVIEVAGYTVRILDTHMLAQMAEA
jgi:CRP-like cAMP-binding protein